jgi:two-component system, LytTR family, sensor kinase
MKPPLTRVQGVLLYLAGWLPLGALYTLGLRQTAAASYPMALLYACSYLLPGIAAGGVVWQIARRVPWQRLTWTRFVSAEQTLILSYLVAWHGLFFGWLRLVAGAATMHETARQTLGWQLLFATLICMIHSAVFHIVRVFRELREKELAAAAAETLRVRAEMQALRGQLDPHFLFNSLHSITALVREDPPRAEDALLQFAALLRRVLDVNRDATDEVTLADEMKFVDDYLAIERLRLGERLRVTRDIPAEALACGLPAFSIQSLVENAIRHAIAPRRDGGTVTVRAAVGGGLLVVHVEDDGPGAEPASLGGATGVGLGVIRRRLALRHGKDAAVDVFTRPGGGFLVRLSLPAQSAA